MIITYITRFVRPVPLKFTIKIHIFAVLLFVPYLITIAQTFKQNAVMIITILSVISSKNLKHLFKPDADEAIAEQM